MIRLPACFMEWAVFHGVSAGYTARACRIGAVWAYGGL